MATLQFRVSRPAHLDGSIEIIPRIDGVDLTDLIHGFERDHSMETREESYGGLVPDFFAFGPMSQHFVSTGPATYLLGCECGEVGCWPLVASITTSQRSIVWSDFAQPYRPERDYRAFGPFSFDRQEYEAALSTLERELATT